MRCFIVKSLQEIGGLMMNDKNFPNNERFASSRPNDIALEAVYCDSSEDGSRFPSLSYEDGVQAAIKWVLGRGPHPLKE